MINKAIRWFDAFLGLGYEFHDVRAKVILIFDSRKTLLNAWNKVIKWWSDDAIKMRFLVDGGFYEFIMYDDSSIPGFVWAFMKTLNISPHFETFKNDYEGATYLRLALYRPKNHSYELELFDYQKRVTDVLFLEEPVNEAKDAIVLEYKKLELSQHRQHEHY